MVQMWVGRVAKIGYVERGTYFFQIGEIYHSLSEWNGLNGIRHVVVYDTEVKEGKKKKAELFIEQETLILMEARVASPL